MGNQGTELSSLGLKHTLSDTCCCSEAKLCPILCDSMVRSLPVSYVHGEFWARTPDWVAISFSNNYILETWV